MHVAGIEAGLDGVVLPLNLDGDDPKLRHVRPQSPDRLLTAQCGRAPAALQIEAIKLLEHLGDAGADQVPLLAEGDGFGGAALGIGQPGLQRLEVALQPRVLFASRAPARSSAGRSG